MKVISLISRTKGIPRTCNKSSVASTQKHISFLSRTRRTTQLGSFSKQIYLIRKEIPLHVRNMSMRGKRKARDETPEKDDRVSPPPVKRLTAKPKPSTSTTISSFFTPASQKAPPPKFVEHGSLIVASWKPLNSSKTSTVTSVKSSSSADGSSQTITTIASSTEISSSLGTEAVKNQPIKIAAFDLDSTIIANKSGRKFAKEASDWKWWNPAVPVKIRQESAEGKRIVIFTNQNGLKLLSAKNEARYKVWKERTSHVVTTLGVPLTVYAASEADAYRKPRTGMFERFVEDLGEDAPLLDLKGSIFVGDAAGRVGDHSPGDRKFAENIGIPFLTPEEYFLDQKAESYELGLIPSKFPKASAPPSFTKNHQQELVIFVGSPGAGKSTFYKQHLEPLGYKRVNQDILKSRDNCIKAADTYLKEGSSVAVDNTNASQDTRLVWKNLADRFKEVAFRCIYFTTPETLCRHNDGVRAFSKVESLNPEKRTGLPGSAFSMYGSRFQAPTVKEGFRDITVVDFEFRGTDAEYQIWTQHWSS